MKTYRKKGTIEAEPWVDGTDMTGVSVSEQDKPPRTGGMIARDPSNPTDRWYINPDFFAKNYEEVA